MNRKPFIVAMLAFTLAVTCPAQTIPHSLLSVTPAVDDAPTKANDYDWLARHDQVKARLQSGGAGLLMIGDSITHLWGGDPPDPRHGSANDLWDIYFQPRNAVNLGFGWDRTEHVLWRFDHGELDGVHPRVAVILIGTNNVWRDSPEDIATGIGLIVHDVRKKLPRTKILLLGIFPRDHEADTNNRKKIIDINQRISALGKERNVTFLDLGSSFLQPDGTISQATMHDYLHPTHAGYEIWVRAMEPTLAKLYGDKPRG
jgi:lysophospholipase L1-like esterase